MKGTSLFFPCGGWGVCPSKEFPSSHMFPKKFQITPHFYPICFGKCCPPHLYKWAKGGELYTSKWNLLFWRASIVSFILSDGPVKLAHCKRIKMNLGGTLSYSRRGEIYMCKAKLRWAQFQ